jgi:hypothetical protein
MLKKERKGKIMSNKLIGNLSKKVAELKVIPRKVSHEWIDPRTPSWKNRATSAVLISKYLVNAGGFDPALETTPKYGRLPNGEIYRFDGDHTCWMWISIHQNQSENENVEIPPLYSKVIDVSSEEEISWLFQVTNHSGRKNLLPEELAVHCLSHEDEQQLKEVGVRIDIGTGEAGTILGDFGGPKTKINNFKKAVELFGVDALKQANEIVISSTSQKLDEYPSELLSGLAFVFKHVEFSQGEKEKFQKFFNRLVTFKEGNYRGIHQAMKRRGGSVNAKGTFSVAKGLLEEFIDTIPHGKLKTLKGKMNGALGAANQVLGLRE